MAINDITSRPRRGLTAEERHELFREFKLGLFALAALVGLVATLCTWSRGPGDARGAGAGARGTDDSKLVRVVWQPEAARGERPPAHDRATGGAVRDDARRAPENPDGAETPREDQAPPPPPPPGPQYRNYTVQRGDVSLRKIAARTLGDAEKYKAILDANPGLKPNRMRIGQVLRIPVAGAEAAPGGQLAGGPNRRTGGMTLQSPTTPR